MSVPRDRYARLIILFKALGDWIDDQEYYLDHNDARVPVRFDMTDWTRGCGTAACAIGYAALNVGKLKKQGFGMRMMGDQPQVPLYKHWGGWDAVEKFFNLNEYEAKTLFGLEAYRGTIMISHVRARIRMFLLSKNYDKYAELI